MNAARRMVEAGVGKEDFLRANPELAKRYAEDVAFHTGFDAITWVKNEAPATYRAEMEKVSLRDVRLQAANVALRL